MHLYCFILLEVSTLWTSLIWAHGIVWLNVFSLVLYTYRILQSINFIFTLYNAVKLCSDEIELGNSEQWLLLEISAYWINIGVTLAYLIQFVCFQDKNDMSNAKLVYKGIMERYHEFE